MPNKYYAILHHAANNTITFPVKATHNQYDHQVQYAGGYPALFGGTDQGGVAATLRGEVAEESRGTVALDNPPAVTRYLRGQPPHDDLYFYWTDAWATTGHAWGPPADRDEGEMMGVATVSLATFSSMDPPDIVRAKLVALSHAPGGSPAQRAEFETSETAAALVQFVYNCVPEPAGR